MLHQRADGGAEGKDAASTSNISLSDVSSDENGPAESDARSSGKHLKVCNCYEFQTFDPFQTESISRS